MHSIRIVLVALIAVLAAASLSFNANATDDPTTREDAQLPQAAMQRFIGDWEINAIWSDGTTLWARNEYRDMLGGKFVKAITYAKDGDGEPYERYNTIFSYDDATETHTVYGFDNTGTVSVIKTSVTGTMKFPVVESGWDTDFASIKQRVELITENSYRWQVWMKPRNAEDWNQMMDGEWKRVPKDNAD